MNLNKSETYTREGDAGSTKLGCGRPEMKDALRLECIGTIEEASRFIGLAAADLKTDILYQVQNDLQDAITELSYFTAGNAPVRLDYQRIKDLEAWIDIHDHHMNPLEAPLLPGGTSTAGILHIARNITRRAERRLVELADEYDVSTAVMHYMNRVSDFLLVQARIANLAGVEDVHWEPGRVRNAKDDE